jgi:nucleoside-diphosphate-sugar epimerase
MFSVYGSSGFIGSRFVDMYPTESIAIDREQNNPMSADVLYFISTAHNYYIFEKPHLDIDTNLNKLIDVLEAFRLNNPNGVFNFISSWFVYGMNSTMDTKESDYPDPRGFYSITKRAAEQMLMCYCDTYNLKYRILRMTNIIGEGDKGVSTKKNALQHMMGLLKKNEPVKLYDEGSNIRDYMHVDDACRAIHLCINNSPTNTIVNISNRQPVTIGELVRYSKEKMGSTSEIQSVETPASHKVVQYVAVCLNNDKLLSYGYTPSINTLQAVDRILNSI